jgi:RimJ/RimL family protein N-acetyltransferase
MERVWLGTSDDNERAQAAYRKAGFTLEGTMRHAYYQDGRWSDELRMAILRDEWAALPRPRSWELAARAAEPDDGGARAE